MEGVVNVTGGSVVVGAGNLNVTGNMSATGTLGAGNTTITGTLGVSGTTTLSGATNTLTTAPTTLTAGGSEMVNAGWIRRSIRPFVIARNTLGSSAVANNTETNIPYNVEDSDVDGAFVSPTFTVPTGCGGVYNFSITAALSAACQQLLLRIYVNGAFVTGSLNSFTSTDTISDQVLSGNVLLADGNTVQTRVLHQNVGAANRTIAAARFTIVRLGNA